MQAPSSDPYKAASNCFHRSLTQDELAGVEEASIALFAGEDPPPDPEPSDFLGDVYQEITWEGVDTDGHQMAELRVVRFNMVANHPRFGKLTVNIDSSRPGGMAVLRAVNPGEKFPVIHTTRLHVTAMVEAIPGMVLQNQAPALEFVSKPQSQWPPEDTVYTLGVPVRFEDRANPGAVIATASHGAVMVGVASPAS